MTQEPTTQFDGANQLTNLFMGSESNSIETLFL